MRERLQKIISAAGIDSRRHAEAMITAGRVSINGEIIRELGTKADPQKDVIRIDGSVSGAGSQFVLCWRDRFLSVDSSCRSCG